MKKSRDICSKILKIGSLSARFLHKAKRFLNTNGFNTHTFCNLYSRWLYWYDANWETKIKENGNEKHLANVLLITATINLIQAIVELISKLLE